MIPYNKIFSDKIRFEDLTLGAVVPLMTFPSDREKKEERRQDLKDEKIAKDNLTLLAEYERRKTKHPRDDCNIADRDSVLQLLPFR